VSASPILTTDRLELWRPQASDLTGLMAMMQPPELRRHLGRMAPDAQNQFARLLRNAGSWSLYGYGTFVVRLRGLPEIIGGCGVFHSWRGFGNGMDDVAEAGWIIAIEQWGKGIAEEAMRATLDWFDRTHGPKRIACMIEDGNTASQRVAAKLGFIEYGRQILPEDGAEVFLYERLR
jgi:RimJ/RimL family protein N-acetyltransferase